MEKLSIDFAEDILDLIPVGIYIFQDNRFVFVNNEVCKISGYSKEELLNVNPFDLIVNEKERKEIIKNTEKALIGDFKGLPSEQKVKVWCKDGETKHVSLRPLPIIFEGKKAIIVTVVDITKEVLEKEKREKLEEFVLLVNKMLRHDVLNHLSAVIGYLEIYKSESEKNYLEKAMKSTENCIKTLKRLKELEWLIEEGKEMKKISVREVFENVNLDADVQITIEGDCYVFADDGIHSIAENLISNAVEHGKSEIVEVSIKNKEGVCEVRVADRGTGIPDDLKEKVFYEGFSGVRDGRGTGLYIVKRLMEKYGGEVWVEDNSPTGSVFVLKFKTT